MEICNFSINAHAQFYQKADYGKMNDTRKNQLGGYDYYDKDGKIAGHSKKTYGGDYIYYDNAGNKLGILKKDKNSYVFYNANSIPTGSMYKTPTGEYRYQDKLEGGLRSVTLPPGEDIGFFPPTSFGGGAFSPQLEGSFEEKKEK